MTNKPTIPSAVSVVNSLTSTSTTSALSANQGKVLNEKFSATSLYDNSSGSNGTISLSQSSANFTFIDIFFQKENYFGSVEVYSPNGKKVMLDFTYLTADYATSNYIIQTLYNEISISGTSITRTGNRSGYVNFTSSNTISSSRATSELKITKVVGYKS